MCMYMYILITSLMQCGIISLLSPRLVRLSFLLRYSSALHTPTSFNNPQNNLYKRNLLLAFSGCGPHDPLRKSGGSCTMHGEHRHSWQWLSPCNTGALGEFLYPLGLSSPVLSVIEGDRCNYNSDCAMPGVRDCSHLSLYFVLQVWRLSSPSVYSHCSLGFSPQKMMLYSASTALRLHQSSLYEPVYT